MTCATRCGAEAKLVDESKVRAFFYTPQLSYSPSSGIFYAKAHTHKYSTKLFCMVSGHRRPQRGLVQEGNTCTDAFSLSRICVARHIKSCNVEPPQAGNELKQALKLGLNICASGFDR